MTSTARLKPVLVLLVAMVLLRGAEVRAAEPARDLGMMAVTPGTVVFIRTVGGVDLSGRFVSASSQELVMSVSETRRTTVPADQIAQVWKRGDRLRNGAIIGGVFGLAAAIGGQSECSDCSGAVALGIAVGVPVWAGVGALIDRAHVGRTLIYRGP